MRRTSFILVMCAANVFMQAQVWYVTPSGAGNGKGLTWSNAYDKFHLQDAINDAATAGGGEVWVAGGIGAVYTPQYTANGYNIFASPPTTPTTNYWQYNAFVLSPNVKIYGGFAGNEVNRDDRNWATNPTVLSGDRGVLNDPSDNCYHVVVAAGANGAVLDGFTIINGNNGADGGYISVNGCQIIQYQGGGIVCYNSTLELCNLVIKENQATQGGGISTNNSICTLVNVLIADNTATEAGAVYVEQGVCNMVNVTISGNNRTLLNRQGIVSYDGTIDIKNSIVYDNVTHVILAATLTYDNSLIEGKTTNSGTNIDGNTNPMFANPLQGDYRISYSSPCCNKGNYIYLGSKRFGLDLAGNPRVFLGTNVDMGAYEHQGLKPDASGIFYVKQGGAGDMSGSCWADAHDDFEAALQLASTNPAIQEIWVADGTYYPSSTTGFVLPNNVKIYGGFPANADDIIHTSISSRPIKRNYFGGTVLCGHISGNSNNMSYHVVVAAGNSYLDGFVITGGNANGNGNGNDIINGISVPQNRGGGVYATGTAELQNLDIIANQGQYGGGIAAIDGCPRLENIAIHNNSATYGGGMYSFRTGLSAKYIHAYGNSATYGGGIYSHDDNKQIPIMPIFENTSIHDNTAVDGGGIYNLYSEPLFVNVLVYDNNGTNGATIYNDNSSTIVLFHATVTKTTSMTTSEIIQGGTFYAENSIFCLINFTLPTGNNYVNNGTTCYNLFIDSYNGNYSLAAPFLTNSIDVYNLINSMKSYQTRPCALPTAFKNDMVGNPRISGVNTVNYGAYEYDPNSPPFNHNNPFWKSINTKEEETLPQTANGWKLQTYPNPTESGQQITISLTNGNSVYENPVSLKLFSIEGSLLYNKMYLTGKFSMEVPQIAPGIYILQLQTETKETYMGKLVVK